MFAHWNSRKITEGLVHLDKFNLVLITFPVIPSEEQLVLHATVAV